MTSRLICLEVYGEFERRGWYKNITNTQLVNEILTVILYRILLRRAFSLNIIRALELISPGFTEPFKTLSYSLTPWVCVRGGGGGQMTAVRGRVGPHAPAER